MPVIALPTSSGQIAFLAVTIAGFVAFAVTLLWVSLTVTLAKGPAEKPIEREVTPARHVADARIEPMSKKAA
jgi:hypothetical protein